MRLFGQAGQSARRKAAMIRRLVTKEPSVTDGTREWTGGRDVRKRYGRWPKPGLTNVATGNGAGLARGFFPSASKRRTKRHAR